MDKFEVRPLDPDNLLTKQEREDVMLRIRDNMRAGVRKDETWQLNERMRLENILVDMKKEKRVWVRQDLPVDPLEELLGDDDEEEIDNDF